MDFLASRENRIWKIRSECAIRNGFTVFNTLHIATSTSLLSPPSSAYDTLPRPPAAPRALTRCAPFLPEAAPAAFDSEIALGFFCFFLVAAAPEAAHFLVFLGSAHSSPSSSSLRAMAVSTLVLLICLASRSRSSSKSPSSSSSSARLIELGGGSTASACLGGVVRVRVVHLPM